MRNRHIPRVCRHCQAPMASGTGACWRCGVEWASEEQPRTVLRLVPAGAPSPVVLDTECWANEGGSFASAAGR